MTEAQAEAWGIVMKHANPLITEYYAHAERVNEQQRIASRPIYVIAGVIIGAASIAALWAIWRGEGQLARELLLPLLSFAGGLGIGKAASANK